MPLLYKKTLAAPGSSSTKTGGEMGAGRGNGKRKWMGEGAEGRLSEQEKVKQVCGNGLPSRENCYSVPTAVHQTKLPKHFRSMFPFLFSMFIALYSKN